MIEDFIQANGLKAELIELSQPADTLFQAFSWKNISPANGVRCTLFLVEKGMPAIVLAKASARVSEEKIEGLLGEKMAMKAADFEVEEITGYPEEFLPPVSVYGVRTLIDSELRERKFLYCAAGDNRHLLKISLEDIQKSVEEIIWGDTRQ